MRWQDCINRNVADFHPDTDWHILAKIELDGDSYIWMFGLKGHNKKTKNVIITDD